MKPARSSTSVDDGIPKTTIQAFSRTVYKEAIGYGFGQIDVIRLINELMDLCSSTTNGQSSVLSTVDDVACSEFLEFSELPLRGPRVHIRECCPDADAELLESWLPDRYGRFFVLSCATAQQITVESLMEGPSNHLGIVTLHDGRPIGAMAYLDHSRRQKRAELRKLIGDPQARGKGLAQEATRLWINYGIGMLGLEKIYLSTLQTQIANMKLNEDIGFHVEGLLKNEILIDGQRHDVLRMGLCTEDFVLAEETD